jgi:hypothetical protein
MCSCLTVLVSDESKKVEVSEKNIACIDKRKNTKNNLFRKPECRRPLERFRNRWKDNVKVDLKEI